MEYEETNGTWVLGSDPQDVDYYTVEYDTDSTYLAVDQNGDSGTGTWKFSLDYSQLPQIKLVNGSNSTYTVGVSILTSSTLQLIPPDGYSSNYIGERDTFTHP